MFYCGIKFASRLYEYMAPVIGPHVSSGLKLMIDHTARLQGTLD